ncbi:RES family NAD+ phosphorylase [Niastella vici]|uniref:RES family NAD+ phosphorylase n=1 Tax=Niastella vici TaxID=1703345 RepID=UPI0009BF68F9
MQLYRIGKTAHAHDLSGLGAKLHGGRWNYAGIPCIYLTESRSQSLMEYTAHTAIHILPLPFRSPLLRCRPILSGK